MLTIILSNYQQCPVSLTRLKATLGEGLQVKEYQMKKANLKKRQHTAQVLQWHRIHIFQTVPYPNKKLEM